jgi:superoxide dismutase
MEKEKEISEQTLNKVWTKKKKRYIGWLCEHFNENPKIPEKKSYKYKTEKSSYPFLKLLWKIQ